MSLPHGPDEITRFSGLAPLWPLAETVLFPQMLLPLHIHDERHRRLAADAWKGERLIAIGLTTGLAGSHPAVPEMVGLGRILSQDVLPDGRSNLILQGVQRAVILDEPLVSAAYRMARLELYRDLYIVSSQVDHTRRRGELLDAFARLDAPDLMRTLVQPLVAAEVPLGRFCDLLATAAPLALEMKQQVLEELDVEVRSTLLLNQLEDLAIATSLRDMTATFLPEFSRN